MVVKSVRDSGALCRHQKSGKRRSAGDDPADAGKGKTI